MSMVKEQAAILIVDDETNLRVTLSQILSKAGYSVTSAASGEEALACLAAGPFDLIFVDLMMPGMSGIELLRQIRLRTPPAPVIILTAYARLESAVQALRLGASDYLIKPADPEMIMERIDFILAQRREEYRRLEIVDQVEDLMQELRRMDGKTPDEPAPSAHSGPATDTHRLLQRGPFLVDLHARRALLENQPLQLQPATLDYLVTLLRHSPHAVSYEELVREAQGYQVSGKEAREISRWQIHQLRQALETDVDQPRYVVTVRGEGYRIVF